jgi:hypothetical protein
MLPILIFAAAPAVNPATTSGGGGDVTLIGSMVGLASALVGLLIWFLRDRRKSRAEAEVAEATIRASIEKRDSDAHDARLMYVLKQVDAERAFHTQQIADRDVEIARQRTELERRDELVAHLRAQIESLEQRLTEAVKQMSQVREQLNQLANTPSVGSGDH